jgi:hypothetical protein
MFAKIRSSVFIDALKLQLTASRGYFLRGVIRDDKGSVCSTLVKSIMDEKEELNWTGLNDLPYGRYTLELTHGEDNVKMNIVKRV